MAAPRLTGAWFGGRGGRRAGSSGVARLGRGAGGRGRPDGEVVVHEWLKLAVLLLFKVSAIEVAGAGPVRVRRPPAVEAGLQGGGRPSLPGASARWGSFIGRGAVLMPSYVNIGARVGAGPSTGTVGSCGPGGRGRPPVRRSGHRGRSRTPQAAPVVIGDHALVGSRCMITQGARVGAGAVLGEGCILNPGIPVIDAATGEELSRGVVPPWCVGVGATGLAPLRAGLSGCPASSSCGGWRTSNAIPAPSSTTCCATTG